ncbi:hypothetical protein ACHAW6_012735 [Cyclotella cf. meneghiniana]
MSSRYSDDPDNDNWQSGHHFHSRSTPRRNKNNNPIGNWIQNRRRNRSSQRNPSQPRPVGTEAKALENMTKNANFFRYPPEGFVTPIEHSLLYAMILYPEQYPESVVRKEIHDEDFEQYLYVRDPPPRQQQQQSNGDGGGANDDSAKHSRDANSHDDPRESRVSYAQLSALLALSAEKHPSATAKDANSPPDAVGQTLCRRLLKTVTRYAESHSLDRHGEIRELLDPVERRCRIRNEQAALKQLLPAYAGYTLSLVTGNPLPLLIGAAALVGNDPMVEENENVCGFRGLGGRTADLETAGLLDECEDD